MECKSIEQIDMKFIKLYRNSNNKTKIFLMKQKDEEAL